MDMPYVLLVMAVTSLGPNEPRVTIPQPSLEVCLASAREAKRPRFAADCQEGGATCAKAIRELRASRVEATCHKAGSLPMVVSVPD
jgi:hypothetical protein